ncbi:hypothetical protein DFH11DRAFT_1512673 [Phellopilus nigrolimitatus]|nr:hypothetical protein DFH11DRAFT_1512673 [Phellopilus nigrolimitatus]
MNSTKSIDEKHPVLYFADGNIVLSAQTTARKTTEILSDESQAASEPPASVPTPETARTVLFRVHKSICALHSEVFEGMFQGSSALETFEGVPIVEMADSAEEVEAMVEAMYGSVTFTGRRHPDLPLLIGNLMNMARKYGITILQKDLTDAINRDWPSSPTEWSETQSSPEEPIPEPAAAAVFARRFHIPLLRAITLYALSCIDSRVRWDDKPSSKQKKIKQKEFKERGARWHLLSKTDLSEVDEVRELQRDMFLPGSSHNYNGPSCLYYELTDELTLLLARDRDAIRTSFVFDAGEKILYNYAASNRQYVLEKREQLWSSLLRIGQRVS